MNKRLKPFADCPVCGGERLYNESVVKSFEEIRGKLRWRQFSQLRILGQFFTVSEDWSDERLADNAGRKSSCFN